MGFPLFGVEGGWEGRGPVYLSSGLVGGLLLGSLLMGTTAARDVLGQAAVVAVGTSMGSLGGLLVVGLGSLGGGVGLAVQFGGEHGGLVGIDSAGCSTTAPTGNDGLIHKVDDGLLVTMMTTALSDVLDDVGKLLATGGDNLGIGAHDGGGVDEGSGVQNLGHWFAGWWRVGRQTKLHN